MGITIWQKYEVLFWVLIGISIYLFILTIIYLILKLAFHKKLGNIGYYLIYFLGFPFWIFGEIIKFPKRKAWLIKSGLGKGQSYLEEGFGIGTSPILASKIVGSSGAVYALDNHPLHVATLFIRSKIRRIKNIKLVLSDAADTGLEDSSIDTVFICDAFHEFIDKKNAVLEIYRVLKPEGNLAIWEETARYTNNDEKIIKSISLFKLVEKDKAFIRFKK